MQKFVSWFTRPTAKLWSEGTRREAERQPKHSPVVLETAVQRELVEMAALFQEALVILKREPREDETLGAFFRDVPTEKLAPFGHPLRFDSKDNLIVIDGSAIIWTRTFGSCPLFEYGSVASTEYTFSAVGHPERSQVTI